MCVLSRRVVMAMAILMLNSAISFGQKPDQGVCAERGPCYGKPTCDCAPSRPGVDVQGARLAELSKRFEDAVTRMPVVEGRARIRYARPPQDEQELERRVDSFSGYASAAVDDADKGPNAARETFEQISGAETRSWEGERRMRASAGNWVQPFLSPSERTTANGVFRPRAHEPPAYRSLDVVHSVHPQPKDLEQKIGVLRGLISDAISARGNAHVGSLTLKRISSLAPCRRSKAPS